MSSPPAGGAGVQVIFQGLKMGLKITQHIERVCSVKTRARTSRPSIVEKKGLLAVLSGNTVILNPNF